MRHSAARSLALLTRHVRLSRVLALSVIVGCIVVLPTAAQAAPSVTAPRPSLTSQWWKTYLALPASQNPADRCDLGIDKVVFLGVNTGTPVSRSCTLPAGTSILVPLINIECSRLEGDGQTPAEWRACAEGIANDFTDLRLTVNGVPISTSGLRVQSPPFAYQAVPDNTFGQPPGTSGAVSDGYWALIGPLAPGTYDIAFGGSYPPAGFSTSVSYHLTVV
jgi:hypothetical protein